VAEIEPVTELESAFSSPGAVAIAWARGLNVLQRAAIYWVSTVRPDARPHVTPLLGVWRDGAMYFCTGAGERKAKNLEKNSRCILTTGANTLDDGIDVVVEGDALQVTDTAELASVADVYESKYGAHFTAPEGTWFGLGDSMRRGETLVYRVAPVTVLGFGKGEEFTQTRWRFVGP
jgi:general stress protein 26